jgi:hypothetical protein
MDWQNKEPNVGARKLKGSGHQEAEQEVGVRKLNTGKWNREAGQGSNSKKELGMNLYTQSKK